MKIHELIQQLSVFNGDLPVVMESDSGHFSDPAGIIRVEPNSIRSVPDGVIICSEDGYALKESLT